MRQNSMIKWQKLCSYKGVKTIRNKPENSCVQTIKIVKKRGKKLKFNFKKMSVKLSEKE